MKNKKLYYIVMIVSIILFVISISVFSNTTILGPIMIVISIYLFIGVIIKLCKQNEKLKNTILCALDLLFWLP